MKRTFLVTGGAGFIGSHLIDKLLPDNKIICVDDFNDFYSPQIKLNNILEHKKSPNYILYNLNICDYKNLKHVFETHQITDVVHLAARAGVRPSLSEPLLYAETNINGTLNLLELTKLYNIKNFVFASSSSVYGVREKGPFKEDAKIDMPISPYAATKAACEQLCYTYSHLYGIKIACLRFFTVYGPRQRPDLAIHKFANLITEEKPIEIYGDGTSIRDYTYIDDIIQGVLASIDYNDSMFEIFNLGESHTVRLDELIKLIEKNIGTKAKIIQKPLQAGDVPITYASIEKARKLLSYNPTTNIEKGIELFADWFKKAKTNSLIV